MKRIVIITVVAMLLALALPAYAKGAWTVTLSGGGQQVTYAATGIQESNQLIADLVTATRLYEGMWGVDSTTDHPSGELGQAIEAVWFFIGPEDDIPIIQLIYPFAENGPVARIPGGQVFIDRPVSEAWVPVADDIVERLVAVGFDPLILQKKKAVAVPDSAASGDVDPEPTWVAALVSALAAVRTVV